MWVWHAFLPAFLPEEAGARLRWAHALHQSPLIAAVCERALAWLRVGWLPKLLTINKPCEPNRAPHDIASDPSDPSPIIRII